MPYEIEKNVPRPNGVAARQEYPFRDMEIGDSFAVPVNLTHKVQPAITQWQRRHTDFKFVTRTDKAEGIIRVWRVAA